MVDNDSKTKEKNILRKTPSKPINKIPDMRRIKQAKLAYETLPFNSKKWVNAYSFSFAVNEQPMKDHVRIIGLMLKDNSQLKNSSFEISDNKGKITISFV
jgi:hypothetical protein